MKYFVPYNDPADPTAPVHEHDCKKCVFVGNVIQRNPEQTGDVYVCKDSIIVRYSSEPSAYQSGSLRDYMHILLQPSDYMSDQRWIICQLFDKGILVLTPTFNLPTSTLVKPENYDEFKRVHGLIKARLDVLTAEDRITDGIIGGYLHSMQEVAKYCGLDQYRDLYKGLRDYERENKLTLDWLKELEL